MSKFDEQLSRMEYLMNYRVPTNEAKKNVEFSAEGADGKRYGIIKEGAKYYIKVCNDINKENIAESYEYIHGITAKKENQYNSYNEATKQLELKLMSLNEAYNGKKTVSTVDFKQHEKAFANLTEEARKELDRMHAIYENSMTIGMNNTGNTEAPKTAKFTPAIGEPFEEKAEAVLDKDFNKTANEPEKQGEPFEVEVEVTDADMESDKAPKGEGSIDLKDAEYVPEDAVAAKKPSGGKVVKMNEAEEDIVGIDDEIVAEPLDDTVEDEELYIDSDEDLDSLLMSEPESEEDDLRYFSEEDFNDAPEMGSEDELEESGFFHNPDVSDDEQLAELPDEIKLESKSSLKRIVESVCDNIMSEHYETKKEERINESFRKYLNKMIKEEMTKLNVFGKHPGYRKQTMTTPENNEIVKTKGDKDWNDDSVKTDKPFGSQIGSSAPFDEKVEMLTDAVMNIVKEALKKK